MYSTEEQRQQYLPKVIEYAKQHFGDLPIQPISLGVNLNYTIGNPPQYFLKIGTRADLAVEKTGLEILRKNGIPAPEIVLYERKEPKAQKQILVLKYIKHDGQDSHDPEELGKTLHNIHKITGKGFGFISPQTQQGTSTWAEFLINKTITHKELIEQALGKTITSLINWAESLTPGNSFLHLDFAGDNVLSKNKKVVAVLDPHSAYGHPLLDVAYTSIMTAEPEKMRTFMEGYAPNGMNKTELDQLRKYRMIAALDKYGIALDGFKHNQQEHNGGTNANKEWKTYSTRTLKAKTMKSS